MDDDMEYVARSTYRMNAMKSLRESMKVPSMLAKDIGVYSNHISTTLRQLEKRGLVECVNPEFRKGKLYRLTEKGESLVEKIEKSGVKVKSAPTIFQKKKME